MQNIFLLPHIIITFTTTNDAMAAEASFKKSNIPGRLIPVPSNIKAGCGMCWYAPFEEKNTVSKHINDYNLKCENIVTNNEGMKS